MHKTYSHILRIIEIFVFFAVVETGGTRRPWLPASRKPRDREVKHRGSRVDVLAGSDGVGTLANHSGGGGTLQNQFVSRRHGTRHRSRSDDGLDVLKVIETSVWTPGHVHRLLVVSTVYFLFYHLFSHLLLYLFFCSCSGFNHLKLHDPFENLLTLL